MPGGAGVLTPRPAPVAALTRSASPGALPASTRYVAGGVPVVGADHARFTTRLFTLNVKSRGGPGAVQGAPTMNSASCEGGLLPALFCAETRQKYAPAPTTPETAVVFPTVALKRSAAPRAVPTSS